LTKWTVNPNAVLQLRRERQITLFDGRHHLHEIPGRFAL
jgi:hypothetical protein